MIGVDQAGKQHVRVDIDQTRKHRLVREIDHRNAGGRRAAGRDGNDLVILYKDENIFQHAATRHIDQPAAQNGAPRGRLRRLENGRTFGYLGRLCGNQRWKQKCREKQCKAEIAGRFQWRHLPLNVFVG